MSTLSERFSNSFNVFQYINDLLYRGLSIDDHQTTSNNNSNLSYFMEFK